MEQKKKFILAIPTIIIIVVAILGICLIFYNRHFKKLSREDAKILAGKVANINNISCEIVTEGTMQDGTQIVTNYKLKDNKMIETSGSYVTYEDDNENIKMMLDNDEKIVYVYDEFQSDIDVFKEVLHSAEEILASDEYEYKFLKYETMNGVKCASIMLTYENTTFNIWLDRESGMIVKMTCNDYIEEVGNVTMTSYYRYQLNSVTDDDVSQPNIENYEVENI